MALPTQWGEDLQENKDRPRPDLDTAKDAAHDTAPQTVHHIDRRPKPLIGEKDKPPHPSALFALRRKMHKENVRREHAR